MFTCVLFFCELAIQAVKIQYGQRSEPAQAKIVKLDFIYLYFEWEFPSLLTSVGELRIILP
jgi:hypothetical protein